MSHSNVNLATLMGSRICHDLISPIGAINNGLELFGMSGVAQGPEFDLISDSVTNASARIKFFRIAFGAASDQTISKAEITSIIEEYYRPTRLNVDWTPTEGQPRSDVRLALLAALCLESAMPFGGDVTCSQEADRWTLIGRSDKLNFDEALWGLLAATDPGKDLRPADVQFALLPAMAAEAQRKVTVQFDAPEIVIRF